MDHRRGALFFRLAHGLRERIGAVMTVGDDADFHRGILAHGGVLQCRNGLRSNGTKLTGAAQEGHNEMKACCLWRVRIQHVVRPATSTTHSKNSVEE